MTDGRNAWRWLAPLLFLGLLLVAWEATVRIRDTPDWFLPAPSEVLQVFREDWRLLLDNTWVTLEEVVIGGLLAVLLGLATAILIDRSVVLERAVYPLVVASQAIPVIAIAPLLLVWFGHGIVPKIIMVMLIAYFPIVVSTVDGLRSADREQVAMIRTMGGSERDCFQLVRWPNALPSFFSGLRMAASVAVIGAVIGELVGSDAGLGHLIVISNANLRTDRVFACVAILSLMAILLFALVALLERWLLPWRRYETDGAAWD